MEQERDIPIRALAPAEALAEARRATAGHERRWLAIVTGERGDGKTTWCAALVEAARAGGLRVEGLLSPAVFEEGPEGRIKVRIDLVSLAEGGRRCLALPAKVGAGGLPLSWRFDEDAVAWGNGILARAGGGDLVLIDELGPLEFTYGGGFTEGLALLDAGRYRAAVVVIRPELLAEAQARWPGAVVVRPPEWR